MRTDDRGGSGAGAAGGGDGARERDVLDERPPVLGSWRAIYAVVLGALALVVALLWALTEVYR
jgi:hypothetical protein